MMSCREYQHQIVLFLYEELSERERTALDAHLNECSGCKEVFEEQQSLHHVLGEDASEWEVPADLLVESRRALYDELDRVEEKAHKRRWWHVPTFSVVFTPMRMLESAALIAMGLALGVFVSQQQAVPTEIPHRSQSRIHVDNPGQWNSFQPSHRECRHRHRQCGTRR